MGLFDWYIHSLIYKTWKQNKKYRQIRQKRSTISSEMFFVDIFKTILFKNIIFQMDVNLL